MRGDSVRDLYAKALALVLLGLLGATGALVDYWPVRGALPDVAFNVPPAGTLEPLKTALATDFVMPPPVAPARVSAISVSLAPVEPPAAVTDEAPDLVAPATVAAPATLMVAVAAVSSDTVAAMGTSVDLPDPPAVAPAEPKPVDAAVLDDEDILFAAPVAGPASTSAGNDGLLKKTGNQILNVGFTVGTGVATYMKSLGSAIGHLFKF